MSTVYEDDEITDFIAGVGALIEVLGPILLRAQEHGLVSPEEATKILTVREHFAALYERMDDDV